jgi:vancomycin resistance protein YoaR
MTDQPDDEAVQPDEKSADPAPETDLAADPEVAAEPGLVVEDDVEFDLGESEDVPSVAEREEIEEPDAAAEPAEAVAAEEPDAAEEPVETVEPEADAAVDDSEVDDRPTQEWLMPESEPEPAIEAATAVVPAWAAGLSHDSDEPPPPYEPPLDGGDDGNDGDDGERKSHRGRRIVLGVVAVLAALYVGGYFLTGTRMPAHATIGPVDVSGMSPSAARTAVDKALTPHAADPVVLTHGKSEFHVTPADAGLALNLDRTIDRAGGTRSWKPADIAGLFFGKHKSAPVLDVDDAKLQGALATIGTAVDRDVVEPQITFPKAKPLARQPKAGLKVDRAATEKAIHATYLVSTEPVTVPTVVVKPTVDSDALDEEMTSYAKPAVSAPVTIAVGSKKVSLPVTAYAPALVVRVEDGKLTPYIDPKKLAGPLTSTTTGIGTKAVDATVKIENNKPVIVPGKPGVGLQPAEMARKLVRVLAKSGDERKVSVKAKVVEPLVTTADAKALKITERISNFETDFPFAPYRNQNQGRAAQLINGTILKPGQTFSLNKTVGERTVANGFTVGTVINGGVFREELGGGVSQVATTAYNAGFFGGMVDVEHHPHAFFISRYPVGREATVYWGSLDMQFKNPTKYGVLIRAWVVPGTPSSAGQMHVELWSTRVWDIKAGASAKRNFRSPGTQYDDTDKCVPQDPVGGFDIDVYRYFYRPGSSVKVKSETKTAHYQAADHVICGKKPS